MLFSLLFLSHSVDISKFYINDKYLFDPKLNKKGILSSENQWVIAEVLNKTISKSFIKYFNTNTFIRENWYRFYCTSDEIYELKQYDINIYPITSEMKLAINEKKIKTYKNLLVISSNEILKDGSFKVKEINEKLNMYLVQNEKGIVEKLMNKNYVCSISVYPKFNLNNRFAVGVVQTGIGDLKGSGDYLHYPRKITELGYDGTGEVLTIMDSGIDYKHPMFYDNTCPEPTFNAVTDKHYKIKAIWSDINNFKDYKDGHGTHVAGSAVGYIKNSEPYDSKPGYIFSGSAPGSKVNFIDVGYDNGKIIYSPNKHKNYIKYMKAADSHVSSNSWGYDFMKESINVLNYIRNLYDVDMINDDNLLYVFAAGNEEYPNVMSSPSFAKNVLTIGALSEIWAVSNKAIYDDVAYYSARGPSIFGQVKPEVVAPGTEIISASAGSNGYSYKSGTSMATPLTSGAIMVLRQYLKKRYSLIKISNLLMKSLIIACADKKDPTKPDPKFGFGAVVISNLIEEISGNKINYQEFSMTDNERKTFNINVNNENDLRIVMSFNDIPLSPESMKQLYAKLDLFVKDPNGNIFHPFGNAEDLFSTNNRIFIPKSKIIQGKYEISIVSHFANIESETNAIKAILTVVGSTTSSLIPKLTINDLSDYCNPLGTISAKSTYCECNDKFTGLFCQHRIQELTENNIFQFQTEPYETRYFKFSLKTMKKYFNILFTQKKNTIKSFLLNIHKNKISINPTNSYYSNYFNVTKELVEGNIDSFDVNDVVYFSYTNLGQYSETTNIQISIDSKIDNNNNKIIYAVICIIVILIILIILSVIIFNRTKRESKSDATV